MQLVMLSARPQVATETMVHVRHFMPWIDDLVVVCPKDQADAYGALCATVVTDESLLQTASSDVAALDHTTRNFVLRGALARHPAVADEFVMTDDDYRPLKPVGVDGFRTPDGLDRSFYFYDLGAWPGASTPFDDGQHDVGQLLGYLGVDRLAYASHMPQVVRKEIMAGAWSEVEGLTDRRRLCEWALYFNLGRARRPELFAEAEPFRTLCWPQYPHEWPAWVTPGDYAFENFYPDLYRPGHLFDGIPTALDPEHVERHNVEKILRWSEFGRRVARLDFPDDIANPWTGDSVARKASFGVLRGLRKAYDYVALDERARITELQGAVARLEEELRHLRRR